MFRNYLLIAWRGAKKDKVYAILNVAGLGIGIACAMVIFLFVYDELTYDLHHTEARDIYRLNAAYHLPKNGGFEQYAVCGPPIAEVLAKDFPEVKEAVRFRRLADVVIEKPDSPERFYETVFATDSNVFKVFTFPFVSGNPEGALDDARTVVVSEKIARKYFNRTDVGGESLHLPQDSVDLKITGVFSDYPSNTHLKADMLISMETWKTMRHVNLTSWWSYSFHTYLLLHPRADEKALEDKVRFISRKYIPDQEDYSGYRQEYSLIPFSRIHLHSNLRGEMEPNSKAAYVYIFFIVGVFILVVACINFMNLATARSAKRAKEIGLRKVAGAVRTQLVGQFFAESFLTTLAAVVVAALLSAAALPAMNDITGKSLSVFGQQQFWIILLVVLLFVTIIAGAYPSFFLSAFKPVETLKGNFRASAKGNALRKLLVVFQFSISIFLIAGTLVIFNHLKYIRSINLGFEKEKMIFIPTHGVANAANDFKLLKEELGRMAGVGAASLSYCVPGKEMGNNVVRLGWDESAAWSDMRFIAVDHDFISTYGIQLVAGRDFSEDRPSDENQAFILNESGVRRLGWKTPGEAIGQKLRWQNRNGEVIGVVKDFHFMSANVAIEPFIMVMNTSWSVNYLSVKLASGDPAGVLAKISEVFSRLLPGRIFEYTFLDEDFDRQYKAEENFMKVFTFFSIIAIAVAALGLYGLAMFVTEIKLKELGIRKVLGATEQSLMLLLTKDFVRLVLIAALIALPLAWIAMNRWLSNFPLRQEIDVVLLACSGLVVLVVAMLTVAYQSVKAAHANPIHTIGSGT